MKDLYFEISLMLDSLAKSYGAPNASYYFRIHGMKPSKEEYRKKVAEFMSHYEYTVETFKGMPNYDDFKAFVKRRLDEQISKVLRGEDKEVEKRYRYYIMHE